MLMKVVVENGVKKLVPLTADAGSGNPCGTIIAVYSNQVPYGYLPCNGVAFDTAQFPVLYALLGDDHTPDLRECTLVGIGQSDRAVGAHDVYTIGQFKDDQLQQHDHDINPNPNIALLSGGQATYGSSDANTGNLYSKKTGNVSTGRTGTTTHGKQVGVNWCIKATSGINENQADNVLSALNEQRSYSTEEHLTGRKWIDGKPTYEKTIDFGALPNATTKAIAHSITNLGNFTNISVISWNTNKNTLLVPIVSCFNDISFQVEMSVNPLNVTISSVRDFSAYVNTYVTLEYTKTN